MVEAAYILLTHVTDPEIIESPEYEVAIMALQQLIEDGKEN